jgi:Amt family ammonium transporter
MRSMLAGFNTNTAASFGVMGWVSVEYVRNKGKFSVVGACSGAIAGLVGITPAAGYVSLWIAALIGFLTGAICSLCQNVDKWIKIDEGMDVFKLHGIGGMIGSFLTGIFGQAWIYDLDGMGPYGSLGGMDGVGVQVGRQLAEIVAIASYSFTVSCVLLYALKFIPGMHLRVSSEAEMMGLDADQFCDNEQIGDWSMFEQHAYEANISSASSQNVAVPAPVVGTKQA